MGKRKTHEQFIYELNIINPNIEIISKYTGVSQKVTCKCKICARIWDALPDNLLHRKGCIQCHRSAPSKLLKSTEQFIKEMKDVNFDIEIVGDYMGAHQKIACVCRKHNVSFSSSPTHLLNGETGCKKCVAEKIFLALGIPHDEYIRRASVIHENISVLGEYKGSNLRIQVKCNKCGHIWSPIASSLLVGFGCPHCRISKGERKIDDFLVANAILFERQKKYPDSLRGVGGNPLSYDFYLPEYNLLIEYQGQFHDGSVAIQSEAAFIVQTTHDKLKEDYARSNNINLLCVWYYDFDNIEEILSNYLHLQNPVTITA